MRVLFIRHGESTDDPGDQYGGWADFDLTETGRQQFRDVAPCIEELDIKFSKILHSPLKRAAQSAKELSDELGLGIEESIWLKEKNGYGLLSGLNKSYVKEKLPELLAEMEAGYVYGAEPEARFVERVIKSYEIFSELETDVIAVTHGGYLSRMFEQVLNLKYEKAGDAGFVLVDVEAKRVLNSWNFDFSE